MPTARKIARSRFFTYDQEDGHCYPATDERPRPASGWSLYRSAAEYGLAEIDPVGRVGYLVQYEWHPSGLTLDDPGYAWVMQTEVPRTNGSGEERTEGWLGTTDGVAAWSHGRYSVSQTRDGRLLLRPVKD